MVSVSSPPTRPAWLERGQLLNLDETAEVLNVSRATLYRLLAAGELPWVRVGSNRRIDPQDLYAFIQAAKRGPETDTLPDLDEPELPR